MTISPFRPSVNLNGELGNVFYYLDRAIYSIENGSPNIRSRAEFAWIKKLTKSLMSKTAFCT